jgi:hypothetical protein
MVEGDTMLPITRKPLRFEILELLVIGAVVAILLR